MATKQQIQQVKQNVEDSFIDENFGQLDTRGMSISGADLALIDLRDPFRVDDQFAPLDESGRGHGFLKRAIAELADTDTEIQAELRKRGVEDESRPRSFNTPGWTGNMRFERGAWHFDVESDSGEHKQFKISVADREPAAMAAARYLNKNRVSIRALSKDEELYVARLAGMGKREEAVMNFLAYSAPNFQGTDITSDPRYLEVCNQCAWFVFLHSTPQFQDSAEARDFINAYVGNRPITVELLQFAFAAYREHEKKEERGLILGQIEDRENGAESDGPTYEQLDELDTEEISRLREATLRDRAKKIRGGILQ